MNRDRAGQWRRGGLIHTAAFLLGARLMGILSTYTLSIVLARSLGAAGAGLFLWGYSFFVIAGVIARCGTQSAIVRCVAIARSKGPLHDPTDLFALIALGAFPSLLVAIGGGTLLLAASTMDESVVVPWFLVAVLPYAAVVIPAAIARGLERTHLNALEYGGHPLLVLIVLSLAATSGGSVRILAASFAAVTAVLGVVGVLVAVGLLRSIRFRVAPVRIGHLVGAMRDSVPFLLLSVGSLAFTWTDVFLVGSLEPAAQTAIYAAAAKTAGLVGLLITTLELAIAPLVAANRETSSDEAGHLAYRVSMRWAAAGTLFACGCLIVLATPVMGLFGTEFIGGSSLLLILVLGQLVNGLLGPVAMVAAMGGAHSAVGRASVALIGTHFALTTGLVYAWDTTGAAVAGVITLCGFKAYLTLAVLKQRGWRPWEAWDLRMLLPPAGAVLIAWTIWHATEATAGAAGVPLSVTAGAIVFLVAYRSLGMTSQERALATGLSGRLRQRTLET